MDEAKGFRWTQVSDMALRAREIVVSQMHDRDKGPGSFCEFVEAGLRDDCPEMRIALAALAQSPPSEGERDRALEEAAVVADRHVETQFGIALNNMSSETIKHDTAIEARAAQSIAAAIRALKHRRVG